MKEPTQQYSDTIKSLQSRIQALEDENRLLKERLEEAGVSYADIVSGDAEGVVELYDPDQGARIKKFDVTDKIASDFFMMFCRGRKDVYDLRYTNPKTGKNGYYTQCFNRWDRGCHIQKKDGYKMSRPNVQKILRIRCFLSESQFLILSIILSSKSDTGKYCGTLL